MVENAARALTHAAESIDLLALSGEAYGGEQLSHHAVVEGLAYDHTPREGAGRELARRLRAAARDHFGGEPDVWHFHNHSLGKNVHLPAAIGALVEDGAHVLLQIHDFAEDGRPVNYTRLKAAYPDLGTFSAALYPASERIHYATLNGRDAAVLLGAGAAPDRAHLLPNPVAVPALGDDGEDPFPAADALVLYPTRAIRRKNVGEVLLHAALAPAGTIFATTLRPENPEWRPLHDAWEAVARRLGLPVHFGAGERFSFDALMRRANRLITTSVAEGFGLAFLEPALFGKPLVGRNLPAITRDFRPWGIGLDHLYDALAVPTRWVDADALRAAVAATLTRLGRAYAWEFPAGSVERALEAMQAGDGAWDFGRLNEPLQTAVIEAAVAQPAAFDAVREALADVPTASAVAAQRAAVEAHLNLPAYGARLAGIYRGLLAGDGPSGASLDAHAILQAFLDPARLSLLCS